MAADGSIIIDTRIDTAGFGKGAANLKSQFAALGTSVKKLGSLIAAAFSVTAIVNFAKEAIELGSDLQEVQNVVDVTFTAMNEQVNEFAKNAATTAGLSETMAKQYVGTFGAMAKSFQFTEEEAYNMSTGLTQLAGDVASFYNLTQDTAYTKLKSVFTGETESLKDLGVVMTQTALDDFALRKGLGKTTSEMTEQEKVALRYQFVMEQLSAASGDFIRTQDGWANQTRILSLQFDQLKATLGQGLINALTPAIKVLNQIIAKLQTAAEAFRDFTAALFGDAGGETVADEAESAADGYSAAADSAADLAENTEEAGKAAKKYLAGFDEIQKLGTDTSTDNANATASGSSIGGAVVSYTSLTADGEVKDKISPKLQAVIDKIKQLLEPLKNIDFAPAAESFGRLKEAAEPLTQKLFEGLEWARENILVPLAEWTIEDLLPAFLDLLSSALNLLNTAIEALKPLGTWLWDNFLQPIAEWTGGAIVEILGWLKDGLTAISDWISEHQGFVEAFIIVIGSFSAAWALVNTAITIWNGISVIATAVTTAFGAAVAFLTSPIGIAVVAIGALIAIIVLLVKNWDAVSKVASDVWEGIKEVWKSVSSWFKTKILDPISEGFKGMVNGIIGLINGMIAAVISGVNVIIGALNKISFDVPDWVPGIGGKTLGFSIPTLTAPQIPYLAQGAVIPPNAPFMAVLGDQRHGTNIEAPADLIRKIVREEMESGARNEMIESLLQELIDVVLSIQVGDEVIGRAAARYNRKASRAGGY